jgi:hypothetical protein
MMLLTGAVCQGVNGLHVPPEGLLHQLAEARRFLGQNLKKRERKLAVLKDG